MQTLKKEIRDRIIIESKKEFLKYGFKGTSLRKVAEKAGISLSNIYNYFPSKDDIFVEIVKDAADYIEIILKASEGKEYKEEETPESLEWHIGFINMIYKLISVYREQLKLLLVLSEGSIYEGYKDKTVKRYIELQPCNKTNTDNEPIVSYFFMYNFTMFYLNYLENLVREDICESDIKKYLVEMTVYSYNGFKAIVNKDEKIFNEIIRQIGV